MHAIILYGLYRNQDKNNGLTALRMLKLKMNTFFLLFITAELFLKQLLEKLYKKYVTRKSKIVSCTTNLIVMRLKLGNTKKLEISFCKCENSSNHTLLVDNVNLVFNKFQNALFRTISEI